MTGSSLDNGLLHIDLERPINEPQVRSVQIETTGNGAARAPVIEGAAESASRRRKAE